jgi:hypothetical protein
LQEPRRNVGAGYDRFGGDFIGTEQQDKDAGSEGVDHPLKMKETSDVMQGLAKLFLGGAAVNGTESTDTVLRGGSEVDYAAAAALAGIHIFNDGRTEVGCGEVWNPAGSSSGQVSLSQTTKRRCNPVLNVDVHVLSSQIGVRIPEWRRACILTEPRSEARAAAAATVFAPLLIRPIIVL